MCGGSPGRPRTPRSGGLRRRPSPPPFRTPAPAGRWWSLFPGADRVRGGRRRATPTAGSCASRPSSPDIRTGATPRTATSTRARWTARSGPGPATGESPGRPANASSTGRRPSRPSPSAFPDARSSPVAPHPWPRPGWRWRPVVRAGGWRWRSRSRAVGGYQVAAMSASNPPTAAGSCSPPKRRCTVPDPSTAT